MKPSEKLIQTICSVTNVDLSKFSLASKTAFMGCYPEIKDKTEYLTFIFKQKTTITEGLNIISLDINSDNCPELSTVFKGFTPDTDENHIYFRIEKKVDDKTDKLIQIYHSGQTPEGLAESIRENELKLLDDRIKNINQRFDFIVEEKKLLTEELDKVVERREEICKSIEGLNNLTTL